MDEWIPCSISDGAHSYRVVDGHCSWCAKIERDKAICARITNYLSSGGLFNPELMEHQKVRDLLIDARSALSGETKP